MLILVLRVDVLAEELAFGIARSPHSYFQHVPQTGDAELSWPSLLARPCLAQTVPRVDQVAVVEHKGAVLLAASMLSGVGMVGLPRFTSICSH